MARNGPIIIVEDSVVERALYQIALKSLKVPNKPHFFADGEEALQYIENTDETPFLIISDMNMPKMDGLKLREKIIANEHLKKKITPFVYRTGSVSKTDVSKSYELAAQGFFCKNHDFVGLERQLRIIIDYWTECVEMDKYVS